MLIIYPLIIYPPIKPLIPMLTSHFYAEISYIYANPSPADFCVTFKLGVSLHYFYLQFVF